MIGVRLIDAGAGLDGSFENADFRGVFRVWRGRLDLTDLVLNVCLIELGGGLGGG